MADTNNFRPIADRALEMISDGSIVGLGTGHAANAFIHALGQRVKAGLCIRGVATSQPSAHLATELRIPLTTLEEVKAIDVAVDGADEVDPQCNLIKGYGGALVREKVVMAAARRSVILVGEEKLVQALGSRGKLPVEVIPFATPWCRRKLADFGLAPDLRLENGFPFWSDNRNYILDCRVPPIDRPEELEFALRAIPGVVGTGLFLGMAQTVLIQHEDRVEVREAEIPP